MSKGIFIEDKEYTFQEFVHLLARSISTIVDELGNVAFFGVCPQGGVFSIDDILSLLRSVNEYVPGEFEIQRTHSRYYQIVYKPEDKVVESFKERWEGFIE